MSCNERFRTPGDVSSSAGRVIILATPRPAVAYLFEEVRRRSVTHLIVERIPLEPDRLGPHKPAIVEGDVAIVDAGNDPLVGIRLCWALRDLRGDLPIIALACCGQPFTQWHLQRLLAIPGGCSVVDLEATADELARSVDKQLRGRTSMHLQWPPGLGRLAGPGDGDRDTRLIGLVSLGLSDQEIGWQLRMSPHTVHHRIERLRAELGVRNRIELAAWAGCHGVYGRAAAEMVDRSSPA